MAMTVIQTTLGPIEHTELGIVLSHEHLLVQPPGLAQQYPWLYEREPLLDRIVMELREAAAAGVGTIIDVTTPDLGRDAGLFAEASRRANVPVVLASGIWVDVARWASRATADDLAAIFTREIEVGIGDSGVRAGVIKVANNDPPGIGAVEERVLRGAARAALRTGVPVTTHTGPYGVGREQLRIFEAEGLPAHLVAIGHAFTGDVAYLREVVTSGAYLSVDHFRWRADEEAPVIEALARLCAEGFAARIMLGHDHVAAWPGPGLQEVRREPSWWTEVPTGVRQRLAASGVAERDIRAMLVDAPAAFLAGEPG